MSQALDANLLHAHEMGDKQALVTLYAQAAEAAESEDAAGFYLTHAYIFALDCGHPKTTHLHAQLVQMGREA